MTRHAFRTVVKGLVVRDGRCLVGRKEPDDDHPIGGEWHVPGGHLDPGETPDAAIRRELREETGLDVEVAALVDATTFAWGEGDRRDAVQILFHCRAPAGEPVARDDLAAVRWVPPEDLRDVLHDEGAARFVDNPRQAAFLDSL